MNASYEWLRAFVPVDISAAQMRDLLTEHSATVDDLMPLRTDLAAIVVARVVEAGKHPDSDHLWLTRVDAGGDAPLEVVCGAPNVTAGALYPFAPTGTVMPNGMKIERRKIRGIFSNGMLCSARELGLGEDQAGILELHTDAAPGTPFLQAIPVGDTRLVIDVGANRPDLLSHLGLARELSAVSGKPLQLPRIQGADVRLPEARPVTEQGDTAGFTVKVNADAQVRRYMGAVIRGVTIGPSPDWMVKRLEAVGVRCINNVVDATNYVLHELGQPVHAFDLAKLRSPVMVRLANANEKLTTLDGATRPLPQGSVVIADATGSQAVAGVMGGRESEVTDQTRDLFIEVASFDPRLTRRSRRALGLATDASYRFERGVDAAQCPTALERVVAIIVALAGGTVAGAPVDIVLGGALPPQPDLALRSTRVTQVLGIDVPVDNQRKYLESAGFVIVSRTPDALRVRVPTWRPDVTGEVDLVEEVARFHGYDVFPDEIRPFRPSTTFDDPFWSAADRVRDLLVGLGFYETRPMPFVAGADNSHVRVRNPLAENEAHLRRDLLETLARRAEHNLAQREGDVRLFEIGSVFEPARPVPREELRVGIVMMGRRRPPHFTEPQPPAFDEWDAKGIAESLIARLGLDVSLRLGEGDALWRLESDGSSRGRVVRLALDAPVWAAPAFGIEISLGEMPAAPPAERGHHTYKEGRASGPVANRKYTPLPTMPPAAVDLALVVPDDVSAEQVMKVIRDSAGELLERLDLFDQYVGEGIPAAHRSLAWRLTFRHPERTLRDKEIEGRRAKILGALEQELHVRQR